MAEQPDRAVVVGAGMGGLLAVRVLSDCFAEVVVVDRDALPSSKQQRRGYRRVVMCMFCLHAAARCWSSTFPGSLKRSWAGVA
jgi:hypothetical protein